MKEVRRGPELTLVQHCSWSLHGLTIPSHMQIASTTFSGSWHSQHQPGVNPRGARRKTITGCSGLKYRSKMLIIPELKQASLDNSVRGNNYSQLMRVDAVPVSVTTSQSAVLIIRCVPVNHDVSGKMTGSRLPPSQFNSPSIKKKKKVWLGIVTRSDLDMRALSWTAAAPSVLTLLGFSLPRSSLAKRGFTRIGIVTLWWLCGSGGVTITLLRDLAPGSLHFT